jgi:catechol 2,3-dioxygenase-like lactoylglutathione lyase family enzyme
MQAESSRQKKGGGSMILRHVALTCSSEEKSDKFYKNLLGLKKSEPKTIPPALSKALFDINSELKVINYLNDFLHFEIFITRHNNSGTKRIEHVCLEVDDLAEFLEKCRTLQVKIVQVPRGNKLLTFVSDDDDNLFEIKS